MQRTKDPGAIPTNQLYYAQNVRIVGDGLESRGGLEKAIGDQLGDCVMSIIDDEAPTERILIYNVGDTTLKYIDEADNIVTVGSDYTDLSQGYRRRLFSFENQVIKALSDSVEIVTLSDGSTESTAVDLNEDPVESFQIFDIGNGLELCISARDGSVTAWDGEAGSAGNDIGFTSPTENITTRICAVAEQLLVFGPGYARKWNQSDWDSLSYPIALTSFIALDALAFQGKIYICGYDDLGVGETEGHILVYDPSDDSIEIDHSIGLRVMSFCGFNNKLYYSYVDLSGTGNLWIGQLDANGSYDDGVKDLTTQFTGITSDDTTRLIQFNGNIWAGGFLGGTEKLIRSQAGDPSGAWEAMEITSGIVGADMCVHKVVPT